MARPDAARRRALEDLGTPVEVLDRAIEIATRGSNRAYARTVAGVSEVTVRRWLSGALPLQGTALQLARAIVACPEVVDAIRLEPPTASAQREDA